MKKLINLNIIENGGSGDIDNDDDFAANDKKIDSDASNMESKQLKHCTFYDFKELKNGSDLDLIQGLVKKERKKN